MFVWEAFGTLSSDRNNGMGEGPIPFTAIDRYAERYGIDSLEEFDDFRSLIRAMDQEYLKVRASKADAETDEQPKKKIKGRPISTTK